MKFYSLSSLKYCTRTYTHTNAWLPLSRYVMKCDFNGRFDALLSLTRIIHQHMKSTERKMYCSITSEIKMKISINTSTKYSKRKERKNVIINIEVSPCTYRH